MLQTCHIWKSSLITGHMYLENKKLTDENDTYFLSNLQELELYLFGSEEDKYWVSSSTSLNLIQNK